MSPSGKMARRSTPVAEEELRIYQTMVESSPTAMVMIDHGGAIQRVNAQAEALFRNRIKRELLELTLGIRVEADPADAVIGDTDEQRSNRRVVEHVDRAGIPFMMGAYV